MRKKKRNFFAEISKNFFRESPVWRFLMRGGRGRDRMQKYRKIKRVKRPLFAKAEWLGKR